MDLNSLVASFINESLEKIIEIENGLLALEKRPDSPRIIDNVFRAVHTIKGTSGSLELSAISDFSHCMEEILDSIRQRELRSEKGIIDLLLGATDGLKSLIESVARGERLDLSPLSDVMDSMKALGPSAAISAYRIIYIHDPALFNTDNDPSPVVEELRARGQIDSLDTEIIDQPDDPGGSAVRMRWDILVRTPLSAGDLRGLFDRCAGHGLLNISPAEDEDRDTPLLGKILVDTGNVTHQDITEAVKKQKKLGDILVEQGKVDSEEVRSAIRSQADRKVESFKGMISSTIRVDLKKLDNLVNLVGEMAIMHSMFLQKIREADSGVSEEFEGLFNQLQVVGRSIQEGVMSLRMLPVGEVFNRFARLVRELSTSMDKSVELIVKGEDTELDKSVMEKIADPLVHLIRNAIDHGIESIDERIALDKTLQGRLILKAYQKGDAVYIEVSDDGRGLDREKILEKARERNIVTLQDELQDDDIFNLVFRPGFSTSAQVSDISGRGVGMDVVRTNVESLNGRISLSSTPGKGTVVTLKLPLTLAIIEGLIPVVGGEIYIIPAISVLESFRPARESIQTVAESDEMVNVRGEFLPLIRLRDYFRIPGESVAPWEAIAVMVAHEGRRCCLLVDELIGQQQVVIKKFGRAMPAVRGITGGTILGDGSVALVIDVAVIAEGIKTLV